MLGKILTTLVILVAIILGLLASFWPEERLQDIVYVSRFFDIMIPVLAVGALIKYLCHKCEK